MTLATKIVLELVYREDDNVFRATVHKAGEVVEMWEAAAYRTLKSLVVDYGNYTHVRVHYVNADGNPIDSMVWSHSTGWEDAVQDLKAAMKVWAEGEGVDVAANANPLKVVELVVAERAAVVERADAKAASEAAELARKQARETRAAMRADFVAWENEVRVEHGYGSPERRLAQAVSMARSTVDGWDAILAKHVVDVTAHPVHALEWAGSFVEAAAHYEVSKWLVDCFANGALVEDLAEGAMREVLQRARNGSSRSSSTMSNLMDDVKGKAWAATYERLVGRNW